MMLGIPTGEVDQLHILGDALEGARGEDQQRIARVGLEWISLLLAKNSDYGSSVWKQSPLCPDTSPGDAILVRMTDKWERLGMLKKQQQEVSDESIEDTMVDLGAYCLLWLARPKGKPDAS